MEQSRTLAILHVPDKAKHAIKLLNCYLFAIKNYKSLISHQLLFFPLKADIKDGLCVRKDFLWKKLKAALTK